ncbi:MAG TPA: universal stress protein [Burkholderiales bacterium]|nr:universal stress protein [Burkholderiales bacterium]
MYKHILLPTDGSPLSEKAVENGIQFAKAMGARVTGLHVTPRFSVAPLKGWAHGTSKPRARLQAIFNEHAKQYIEVIRKMARAARVPCQCLYLPGGSPYEEIVKTARNKRCDLIYMASHGRKGASGVVLGSETVKVIIHSPVPVLVHREPSLVSDILRVAPRPVRRTATRK